MAMGDAQLDEDYLVFFMRDGKPCGVGFFVAAGHLLTCSHVVGLACGLSKHATDLKDRTVECRFVTNAASPPFSATVVVAHPARTDVGGTAEERVLSDVALLAVDPVAIDRAPRWVQFMGVQGNRPVCMRGAIRDVELAAGRVLGTWMDQRFEIAVDDGKARPGFSGGPVVDQETGWVMGMVQMAPENGGNARFIGSSAIRDAIADCLPIRLNAVSLPVAASAPQAPSAPAWHDQEFMTSLAAAKDREDSVADLKKLFTECIQHNKMAVALIGAPVESSPHFFVHRLADREFAQELAIPRTVWSARLSPPTCTLAEVCDSSRSYETALLELMRAAHHRKVHSPRSPIELRQLLVRRLALVPVHLDVAGGLSEERLDWLRQEIGQWQQAHSNEGKPPFCLLLIVSQGGFWSSVRTRFRRGVSPSQLLSTRLQIKDTLVEVLTELGQLNASRHLSNWINRVQRLLYEHRCNPTLVKDRVGRYAYRAKDGQITFERWFERLQQHGDKIFGTSHAAP